MSLLETQQLGKTFGGVAAISDLSFSVQPGTIYSVIGPNGAGKTTLFNLVSGLYRPTAGKILLNGQDIAGKRPHELARLGMSRTFQNLQIWMNMSAHENVMVGRHMHLDAGIMSAMFRLPRLVREERQCRQFAFALMDFVGLKRYRESAASSMPYGGLKRLEIARALATEPSLLLLDEPAAGLNAQETMEIGALIRKVAQTGVTVLLVEHDMKLVMSISERVLVLDYGRKLAEGTTDEIRRNHEVVSAYLGSI